MHFDTKWWKLEGNASSHLHWNSKRVTCGKEMIEDAYGISYITNQNSPPIVTYYKFKLLSDVSFIDIY